MQIIGGKIAEMRGEGINHKTSSLGSAVCMRTSSGNNKEIKFMKVVQYL